MADVVSRGPPGRRRAPRSAPDRNQERGLRHLLDRDHDVAGRNRTHQRQSAITLGREEIMPFKRWTAVLPVAAFLSVFLLPHAAAAQASSGPVTVQRIGNRVFFAPDFKITDFNGQASGLAGGYGGYLLEDAFFIGAGGYWLTDTSPGRDMWYFGLVTGVYL